MTNPRQRRQCSALCSAARSHLVSAPPAAGRPEAVKSFFKMRPSDSLNLMGDTIYNICRYSGGKLKIITRRVSVWHSSKAFTAGKRIAEFRPHAATRRLVVRKMWWSDTTGAPKNNGSCSENMIYVQFFVFHGSGKGWKCCKYILSQPGNADGEVLVNLSLYYFGLSKLGWYRSTKGIVLSVTDRIRVTLAVQC